MGTWQVTSKEDPRFDIEGRALVGGFNLPGEAQKALECKVTELGVDLPKDLMFEYLKDS